MTAATGAAKFTASASPAASEAARARGRRDGALDGRAPERVDDRPVERLEPLADAVVVGGCARAPVAVLAQLAPPRVVRVDELRERRVVTLDGVRLLRS